VGLLIVAIATIIAVAIEVASMIQARTVTLADMPLYIAIVALARYMILERRGLSRLTVKSDSLDS